MMIGCRFPCLGAWAERIFHGSENHGALEAHDEGYAARLWDYWERHLDPDAVHRPNGHGSLTGKVVVVTGASSGIGRELAKQVAAHGGRALLVAHDAEHLEEVVREIRSRGGDCACYTVDLRDLEACDRLVARILAEHGHVDVLVNNAGKSIRRSVELSYGRFHDFQRTMQLNYFAAVRLILGFLPSMRTRRQGHIVNISTVGVQAGGPRFASYLASKAALDAFSRSLVAEVLADNIRITTVHMPLVRTPMIAPTEIYRYAPALSAEQAASWVMRALLTRQRVVSTLFGTWAAVAYALAPGLADRVASIAYRIVPESAAAKGERRPESPDAHVRAALVSRLLSGLYV
jgi:NAD(P)-dependent dehydrogenase (short-subunit alcohol dehydrogenase family)